jgi:tape measure domain-containing protein
VEGGDLTMKNIEEQVVQMQFDNKQFEAGIKQTTTSLDGLNKSLKMEGATKGLNDAHAAISRFGALSHIASAVDSIANRFSAMSIVAITAISNITNRAIDAGISLAKSLTIDPVKTGLAEYELNLNSIQTILANTQAAGVKLRDVTAALDELNEYSDQTIYNFSEMARNIGTFTAAGVALGPAVDAIKGIANLAALSGSNSMQAATAMYQLSQAISAGKVALIDWNSVVNAGMGGTVFQRALAQTAIQMGKLSKSSVKLAGDMQTVTINGEAFRNTLEKGWLTADVLTNTLAQFTGDLTDAELAAQGFSKAQIEAIQAQAKTAQEAATKVKTMTQLIGVLRESAGSGWAQTWRIIFGDFEEARTLFTDVNNVLGDMINQAAESRNKLLDEWKDLGGRTILIEALGNAFKALMSIIQPIGAAWRTIFPAVTAQNLVNIVTILRDFTAQLKLGYTATYNLRRTFQGIFAVLGILFDLGSAVTKMFFRLFGVVFEGTGSLLAFTGGIGDFLVELRNAIKNGQVFEKVFGAIGDAILGPLVLVRQLAGFLGSMFDGFDPKNIINSLSNLSIDLSPLADFSSLNNTFWENIGESIVKVYKWFVPLAKKVGDFFSNVGSLIMDALSDVGYDDILNTLSTGLFAALAITIINFIRKFSGMDGILSNISETFEEVTNTMKSMQNTLRAATLLQIAAALALLTVSVVALSKIDSERLAVALSAIAIMFTQLLAALAVFEKFSGFSGLAKLPLVAAGMIIMGVAVNVLASAVKKLAGFSWNEIAVGLTGTVTLLGALVGAVRLMPPAPELFGTSVALVILAGAVKLLASAAEDMASLSWSDMSKGLIGVGAILGSLFLFTKFAATNSASVLQVAGIILLAGAIKLLAMALADFAVMSWAQIGQGLATIAGGLVLMGAALKLIPPTTLFNAASILIVALSLSMIADAVKDMGGMKWEDIGAGLTTLAGALTIIGVALSLISPTAPLAAAGILILSWALSAIADVIKDLGAMSWPEIGRSMTLLAGTLGILAAALYAMQGSLGGAAALVVVTAALMGLAPVMLIFSKLSWGEIGRGLAMLAGMFVILGLAGVVLTPVIPTLLGLALAVGLLGGGLLLAGAGILAFSLAISALSLTNVENLLTVLDSLGDALPILMEALGKAVVSFATVIGENGPQLAQAFAKLLISGLQAVDEVAPKIIETAIKFIDLFLTAVDEKTPEFTSRGYSILISFMTGVRDNIQEVVKLALEIIAKIIDGIGLGLPKVIEAGHQLIISFVRGLAKSINDNSEEMGKAGGELATAMIKGLAKGLIAGGGEVADAARDVAKAALKAAKKFLGIESPSKETFEVGKFFDQGLEGGLYKYAYLAEKAASSVGDDSVKALKKSISAISTTVAADPTFRPVITPVMDLSLIRKDADQIGSMFRTTPISLDATFTKAKDASSGYQANQDAANSDDPPPGTNITFNQTNNSPKPISPADVYRQTSNQIAKVKGALPK